jgi:hypothetical protein
VSGAGQLVYTYYDGGENPTEVMMVNDVTFDSPKGNIFQLGHPIANLILNGLVVTNPTAANYIIAAYKAITNISMANCAYVGTNATKVLYSDLAITIGKILHNNNLFPNLTTFRTGTGALAALECVGGSLGVDRILRGTGSPLNVISAPIGTMFLRSDGGANTSVYIKESGTDATGWVAK